VRTTGLNRKEVLAQLKRAREKDLHFADGRILNSMCTSPLLVAKLAHGMFLEGNLGDPGLFPGSMQLEREAIASLAELLHGPKGTAGFIVSGGTEANLMALYAARNATHVESPEIVVPESAHFSFDKICDMLKLKMVTAKLDATFRVDPASVAQCITKRTIAILGNAGSAELGTVDPIGALSEIALEHGVPLHVDAAFGGLVLPFLRELDYSVPDFDFALSGVQSITVDPHKMGMSTIPAGGILFRNSQNLKCIKTQTPYLTEETQCTFVGTRPAASAAAAWAVFESLGREGFRKVVGECMELTTFLYEGLEEVGFEVLLRPQMNIVAFRNANPRALAAKLRQSGWRVSFVPRLNCIRVVVMPHLTKKHITDFLACLRDLDGALT
jgi:tyrosine decarboxylase / aspartate 1-decarboxylase